MLQWGKSGTDYNFGELLPGSIRGRVIADTDFDCELDPGEQPLSGVRVDLLDDQGNVLQTAHTNGQGYYEFTGLRPGTYRVYEHQPTTHFHSSQKIGSGGGIVLGQDTVGSIVVGSDQHLVDYNFCEIPPATLAGFVFQDGGTIRTPDGTLPSNWAELRDGQRTSDDRPLAGVVLELRHGVTGEAIRPDVALDGIYSGDAIRVVTDANGYYQFVGLPPGIYAVFEVHPDSYLDGIDTPGTTGGVAVNPHDPVSPLVLSQLTTNPADDAILRIRLTPGQVSVENNFSEVRVEQQPEEVFYPPPERPTYTPGAPPTLGPRPMAVDPPLVQPPLYTYAPWPGRSSVATGYTWHLSVVDAGQPRAMNRPDVLVRLTGTQFDVVAWRGKELDRSSFTWQEGTVKRAVIFGNHEAIPVAGDFNGDGRAEIGVFIKGEWFIDVNGNGVWDEGDLWAKLGHDGDQPVTGDWDADGKTDIGIFGPAWPGDPKAILKEPGLPDPYNVRDENPKNLPPQKEDAALGARTMKLTSTGQLRADLIDHVFHYGTAGDRAVTGDWNGDGIETIAVFRHGRWHLDVDGDGKWTDRDRYAQFGASGDLPVVGDWNGNGVDDLGIYRAGTWYLDTNGNRQIDAADKVFEMGTADDLPIAADFNGEGTDQPGIYRPHGGNAETARR